jgi:hypothetical protein
MSKLLSRHDRWELWMSSTPGAQTSEPSPSQTASAQAPRITRREEPRNSAELIREVERLRGVIHTAVAALAFVGAHDEAARVRTALESQ